MGVALITPFKEDESVDYDALMRLVDYQLQNNTDFLCVLGTTAETPTLTEEEKKKIKKMVIERVNGRIPILLGVGGNNTRAIVETLKNDDFTGVDAILSVVPYYNKPSQEGIYQHYKAISEATDLPIVLYNVPGRTGVNMKAETTLRIARDFKNVIAVKEASGDITQMDDIIKNKPANFDVISGDDGITFPLITLGAVGIISVIKYKVRLADGTEEARAICLLDCTQTPRDRNGDYLATVEDTSIVNAKLMIWDG
jgi:4-hydroxy-tetrahydrodipicolinate synthase